MTTTDSAWRQRRQASIPRLLLHIVVVPFITRVRNDGSLQTLRLLIRRSGTLAEVAVTAPGFDDLAPMFVDTVRRVGSVRSLHQLVELASSVFEPLDLDVDVVDLAVDE